MENTRSLDKTAKAPFPVLQAHRGVASEYPENTAIAFEAAIKQGYGVIELDPNYTADNQIVVLHDRTLNRTARSADGTPLASELAITDISWEEAQTYDCGSFLAPKFADQRIPLLADILRLARDGGVKVKIDNKIERFPEPARKALDAILSEYQDTVGLTSTHAETLEAYAQIFPRAELHYDGAVNEDLLRRLAPLGQRLTVWLPEYSPRTAWAKVPFADRALCELVKRYARLGIWIVEDEDAFQRVCDQYKPAVVETTGRIKPEGIRGVRYDLHVHSRNSHDSQTPVADCAKSCPEKGLDGFAVTDHLDVEYYGRASRKRIAGSVREAAAVAEEYRGRIKVFRGVEVGEGTWYEKGARKVLDAHSFDVVLASVHAVRFKHYEIPYSKIDFRKLSAKTIHEYLNRYFDELLETIQTIPCDVVSHLTCPLRYINAKYGRDVDLHQFEEKIDIILRYLIDHALALEINTSCDDFFMPEEWIIQKYRQMGGYLVTVGSDAHVAQHLAKNFDKALAVLRKYGFPHYYYFENRIGIPCGI